MPRLNRVKAARTEHHCSYCGNSISIGSGYWWWKHKLRRGGMVKKRCMDCGRPKRYMLTLSSFFSALWQAEDSFAPASPDDLEGAVIDLLGSLESIKDDLEYSLEAMPEPLQDSSESGQMLQERIEGLEVWIESLENIDTEVLEEIEEEALMDWLEEQIEAAMEEKSF